METKVVSVGIPVPVTNNPGTKPEVEETPDTTGLPAWEVPEIAVWLYLAPIALLAMIDKKLSYPVAVGGKELFTVVTSKVSKALNWSTKAKLLASVKKEVILTKTSLGVVSISAFLNLYVKLAIPKR